MDTENYGYGIWVAVVVNAAIFIGFAFGFTRPKTSRDWRSLGAFSAFIVALFTEMYGFPLTIYLLSGWLKDKYPGIDVFSHDSGHLWETLLGWGGDPHLNPFHLLSFLFIGGGLVLLASAWRVLYEAQRSGQLATSGPYAHLRHPQYAAFVLIMLGLLVQWPTLVTLIMFPILVLMYRRLALTEEKEVAVTFGKTYTDYAAVTPRFFPHVFSRTSPVAIQTRHRGVGG